MTEEKKEEVKKAETKKGFSVPHIFLIIACIILLACLLTYIAPPGAYQLDKAKHAIPGSYHAVARTVVSPWEALLMVKGGVMNASSVISMLLIAGGSLYCVMETGAFNDILDYGVFKLQDRAVNVLVPAICVLMSALGAFAGNDSMIAFVTVGLVICKRLRLDRITAMALFYLSYLLGQGSSFTSFMLIVFQDLAGVRPLSGMGARIIMWIIFTLFDTVYCTRYALKITKDPSKSLEGGVLEPDDDMEAIKASDFPLKALIVVAVMFANYLFFALYGGAHKWGQEYLCALLILDAAFSCLVYRMNANKASKAFFKGAQSMGGICLVMGFARVVGFVLTKGNIIHTLSNAASGVIQESGLALAGVGIFVFTLLFNLFIPSGMSKAAIMMPVLTPIGDVCGLTRQVVAFAYQFGDSLTNTLTPMSGPLVGALGLAGVDYNNWVKYAAPLIAMLTVVSGIMIAILATIGYMG